MKYHERIAEIYGLMNIDDLKIGIWQMLFFTNGLF